MFASNHTRRRRRGGHSSSHRKSEFDGVDSEAKDLVHEVFHKRQAKVELYLSPELTMFDRDKRVALQPLAEIKAPQVRRYHTVKAFVEGLSVSMDEDPASPEGATGPGASADTTVDTVASVATPKPAMRSPAKLVASLMRASSTTTPSPYRMASVTPVAPPDDPYYNYSVAKGSRGLITSSGKDKYFRQKNSESRQKYGGVLVPQFLSPTIDVLKDNTKDVYKLTEAARTYVTRLEDINASVRLESIRTLRKLNILKSWAVLPLFDRLLDISAEVRLEAAKALLLIGVAQAAESGLQDESMAASIASFNATTSAAPVIDTSRSQPTADYPSPGSDAGGAAGQTNRSIAVLSAHTPESAKGGDGGRDVATPGSTAAPGSPMTVLVAKLPPLAESPVAMPQSPSPIAMPQTERLDHFSKIRKTLAALSVFRTMGVDVNVASHFQGGGAGGGSNAAGAVKESPRSTPRLQPATPKTANASLLWHLQQRKKTPSIYQQQPGAAGDPGAGLSNTGMLGSTMGAGDVSSSNPALDELLHQLLTGPRDTQLDIIEFVANLGETDDRIVASLSKLVVAEDVEDMIKFHAEKALIILNTSDGSLLQSVTRRTKDKDWRIRADSIKAIADIGVANSAVVTFLVERLSSDWNEEVRQEVTAAINELDLRDDAATALVKLLGSPEAYIRIRCCQGLEMLGLATPAVVDALLERCDDISGMVRSRALECLGSLRVRDPLALSLICRRCTDHNRFARSAACLALGNIGVKTPAVVHALILALQDLHPRVAADAETAMERLQIVMEDMETALKGDTVADEDVVVAVGRSQETRPETNTIIPGLIQIAASSLLYRLDDDDAPIRGLAARALRALGIRGQAMAMVLMRHLNDVKWASTYQSVIEHELCDEGTIFRHLYAFSKSGQPAVRRACASVFGCTRFRNRGAAMEALLSMCEDTDETVWAAAISAWVEHGAESCPEYADQFVKEIQSTFENTETGIALRFRCATALVKLEVWDPAVSNFLTTHLKMEVDEKIILETVEALALLPDEEGRALVPLLREHLPEMSSTAYVALVRTLVRFGLVHEEVIALSLVDRVRKANAHWPYRADCIELLGKLQVWHDKVVSLVISRLTDADPLVRSASTKALGVLLQLEMEAELQRRAVRAARERAKAAQAPAAGGASTPGTPTSGRRGVPGSAPLSARGTRRNTQSGVGALLPAAAAAAAASSTPRSARLSGLTVLTARGLMSARLHTARSGISGFATQRGELATPKGHDGSGTVDVLSDAHRNAVLDRLLDGDDNVRVEAARACKKLDMEEDCISVLLAATRAPVPSKQIAAIRTLAAEFDSEGYAVVEILTERLLDTAPGVALEAATAIRELKREDQAIEQLCRQFAEYEDRDGDSRDGHLDAIRALSILGIRTPAVIDLLLKGLADDRADIRSQAALMLAQLGAKDDRVVEALLRVFVAEMNSARISHESKGRMRLKRQQQNPDNNVSIRIIIMKVFLDLQLRHPSVLRALIANLEDHEAFFRIETLKTVANLGVHGDELIEALGKRLRDDDPSVRAEAVRSLPSSLRINDMRRLLAGRADEKNSLVRVEIAKIVGAMDLPVAEIVEAMILWCDDRMVACRCEVVKAIGMIHVEDDPRMAGILAKRLDDNAYQVRAEALRAVGRLRVKSAAVLQSIVGSLSDRSHLVRVAALEALQRLGVSQRTVGDAVFYRLMDWNDSVVLEAAKLLAKMGAKNDRIASALLLKFDDNSESARTVAARGLALLGLDTRSVVHGLRLRLETDISMTVRCEAAVALQSLGQVSEVVLTALIEFLYIEDPAIRAAAVTALGSLGELQLEK